MKGFPRAFVWGVVAILSVLCFSGYGAEAAAWDPKPEVARLFREMPRFEGRSRIAYRALSYDLRADGSVEQEMCWIIDLAPGEGEGWRTWDIPVPEGGEATIRLAGLYDPMNGRLVAPLLPEESERDGIAVKSVRVPPNPEEVMFVLAATRIVPKRMNVDDVVWLGFDIPVWEQQVSVEVPGEARLHWIGSDAPDPEILSGVRDTYSWRIINRPVWNGDGLRADGRPFLLFSLRKGFLEALRPLRELETMALPAPDGAVKGALEKSNKMEAGMKLLDLLGKPEALIADMPWDWIRAADKIQGKGPWTAWERVLLARKWLEAIGWKARLWWVPAFRRASDDVPASSRTWIRPVLELLPPGGTTFWCDPGQAVKPGEIPSSLWGKDVFRLDGLTVKRESIPEGSLEEHRLSIEWNVSLDAQGIARGYLDVVVRGGWGDLVGSPGSSAREVLRQFRWPAGQTLQGEPVVETYSYGFRLRVPVVLSLGISGTGQLLARFPYAGVPLLEALEGESSALRLRFPFVVEERFLITLPDGHTLLDIPDGRSGSGPIAVKSELRLRRKHNILQGEIRFLVKHVGLNADDVRTLQDCLLQWKRWSNGTIPLKRK